MGSGFEHIVKKHLPNQLHFNVLGVCMTYLSCVLTASTLPEGKGVHHDDISGANDGISSTIRKLIPTISSANLDASGQLGLDSLNLALELLAREVASV